MRMSRKPFRTRVTVAVSAVAALGLVAGCSEGSTSSTGGSKKDGKVTITMGLFGVMGFKETGLLEQYEKENPGVTIKAEIAGDEQTYYTALQTRLAGGSGLKDIQGIEVLRAKEIVDTQSGTFADFSEMKGSTEHYQPWKLNQLTTPDGKLLGLGTDIGPMAVCYRKDMFEQAGLPTDREEVAKLWEGDWKKYVETGKKFKARSKDRELSFMDSSTGLFNAMIYGSSEQFYDKEGELIYTENPVIKEAWDLAAEAGSSGMTAELRQFQKGWDPGLANSTFATTVCPAWMLGHITEKAGPANKGKWDIAKAPKGANWGGSFLGVVEKSPVKAEAQKLVAWLTAPEQQATMFKELGMFPSSKKALETADVTGVKSAYFDSAPIGQIFGAAANEIPAEQVLGRKDGTIKDIFSMGLSLIEAKGKKPAEAWKTTDERIRKAVG